MAEFSDYLEGELLDHAFSEGARLWTAPGSTLYLALLSSTASDTNTGSTITEPTVGAYSRAAITFKAASGGSTLSSGTITITNTHASLSWTVVGVAIVDATSAGNMFCFDNDMTDATIGPGEKIQFVDEAITISLT